MEEKALEEITEIEHRLTELSREYGFKYNFEITEVEYVSSLRNYQNINIKVYKELN